jgi:hypothetical protein
MRKPETEILTGLTDLEYRELRKIVVNCILSTDMLKHVEIVTKCASRPVPSRSFRRRRRRRKKEEEEEGRRRRR